MSFQVVTCASREPTEDYYFLAQFYKSLERFGVPPVILGRNEWWGGLGTKPKLLLAAIESGQLNADHLIVVDCFDLVFAAHPEEVLARYLALTLDHLLWGAEKSCFPDATLAGEHPKTDSPFRFLNSGVGIGPATAFHQALKAMDPEKTMVDDFQKEDGTWHHDNDQDAWMRQFLFGDVPMALDCRCQIVQNFGGVGQMEMNFSGEKIKNKLTGTEPAILHCNGAKEFWKPRILEKLELS